LGWLAGGLAKRHYAYQRRTTGARHPHPVDLDAAAIEVAAILTLPKKAQYAKRVTPSGVG